MTVGPSERGPYSVMTRIENVGEGWHPLVRALEQRLLAIDPNYELVQIKEKFGGLRYYASSNLHPYHPGNEFDRLISEAEEESFHVCEVCGEPGELDQESTWLKTLCPEHAQERRERKQRSDDGYRI